MKKDKYFLTGGNYVVDIRIQARGHLVADLDPLGIMQTDLIHTHYAARKGSPEQVLRQYMLGKAFENVDHFH